MTTEQLTNIIRKHIDNAIIPYECSYDGCRDFIYEGNIETAHQILGVICELGELCSLAKSEMFYKNNNTICKEDLYEELGDLLWFTNLGFRYGAEIEVVSKHIVDGINNKENFKKIESYTDLVCVLLDINKSMLSKCDCSNCICTYVYSLLIILDVDIEKIVDVNIKKLQTRYGNRYSKEKALNRDLQKEIDSMKEDNN